MFCTMLKYKAEAEGNIYLEVGRFFPKFSPLLRESAAPTQNGFKRQGV